MSVCVCVWGVHYNAVILWCLLFCRRLHVCHISGYLLEQLHLSFAEFSMRLLAFEVGECTEVQLPIYTFTNLSLFGKLRNVLILQFFYNWWVSFAAFLLLCIALEFTLIWVLRNFWIPTYSFIRMPVCIEITKAVSNVSQYISLNFDLINEISVL